MYKRNERQYLLDFVSLKMANHVPFNFGLERGRGFAAVKEIIDLCGNFFKLLNAAFAKYSIAESYDLFYLLKINRFGYNDQLNFRRIPVYFCASFVNIAGYMLDFVGYIKHQKHILKSIENSL